MTAPKTAERPASVLAQKPILVQKLPPALKKLLAMTPEEEWPKIRAFLIESEEEGELVEMLPEINRVMKICPQRLMGLVGRREIRAEELDRFYTLFHDSIHGVRQALFALLDLAGFREVPRPELPRPGAAPGSAPGGASTPQTWHEPAVKGQRSPELGALVVPEPEKKAG